MLIEKSISGKVLRAQVRRHVGLHQVDVELGVDEEVEADHLEEAATVRILGGSFDEVRLLQGEHAPEENNRSVQFHGQDHGTKVSDFSLNIRGSLTYIYFL